MKTITDTQNLVKAMNSLHSAEFVTVDTEFKQTNTFWPILCLIQIAGPNDAYIIDPLAKGIDLASFYEIMADTKILKVFHASRQDLEIFYHENGALPHPVFDTQIASMVCGFGDSVGYETLVSQLANAQVDKSSRFTDWSRRPLSKQQLNYAIGDVTHLRVVYERLADMLEENGRTSWLDEEMEELESPGTYFTAPEDAWLRLKTKSNNRRFLGLVKAVAGWREICAQTSDVPRNRVMRDDIVMELAAHPPRNVEDLKKIRNIPSQALSQKKGTPSLLECIAEVQKSDESSLPEPRRQKKLPRGIGPTVDLLKVLLKQKCEAEGVAQKLVANVSDLELLAADDQADVTALKGWRKELFGSDAIALKQGKLSLSVSRNQIIASRLDLSSRPE